MSERLSLRDKLLIHKACRVADDTMFVKKVRVEDIIGKHDRKNKKYNRLARLIQLNYFTPTPNNDSPDVECLLINDNARYESEALFDYILEKIIFSIVIPIIVSIITAWLTVKL